MQLNNVFYLVQHHLKRETNECDRLIIGEVYKWLKDYPSGKCFPDSKRRF